MLELEVLSREECDRHLRDSAVARVAVCTPDGPHVVPVNYALVDDSVVVRTVAASVLGTHAPGNVVCLEVDDISPVLHAGWSVLVRGRAEALTPDALDAPLRTWVPRESDVVLRLRLAECEVSGRLLPAGAGRRS